MSQPRKKLWGSIDEAGRHLGRNHDVIIQRLVPLSYHTRRKQGHIRFRVLAVSRKRVARLWWEDVVALSKRKDWN